jgi:hypothetical protein
MECRTCGDGRAIWTLALEPLIGVLPDVALPTVLMRNGIAPRNFCRVKSGVLT